MTPPRTLLEKLWDAHVVRPATDETPATLYVDLHLIHEVTSPQAFAMLRERGLTVRRPERTVATMDHSTPTTPRDANGSLPVLDPQGAVQLRALQEHCERFGIRLYAIGDEHQGIVHVIGPELGLTQPGMTIACGDSHTSTHGAFGALAFGIGTTEVGHVLATQCLLQQRPKALAVEVEGRLGTGVTAKDLILALIGKIGTAGATGCAIEYRGPAIRALSMEERMTVCNMSIEAGARAGFVAPDDVTFAYLAGRPFAPRGAEWDRSLHHWRTLASDPEARFDREVRLDATQLEPMITYGTNPGMVVPIREPIPHPGGDASREQALRYMGLEPGRPLVGHPVSIVFIGSCTNSRLTDLRLAAKVMGGRRIASGIRVLVVPGSQQVKHEAEAEGLHKIFREAGAEWREPGCSMCIAMNGDQVPAAQYAVSTSNRNFEGRQ
ncbi:MAG: 3-isopropylmalate dehydratase large subunit, partial [Gemmatimonadetes bacterium]|nr:3-isopropylmalate dehydratase large subunit [Gemmatimonadota bacterium]